MLWRERITYRDASGRRHLRPFARIGLLILATLTVLLVVAVGMRVYVLTRPVPTPKLPAAVILPPFPSPTAYPVDPPTVVFTRPRLLDGRMMRAAGKGWAVGPGGIYRQASNGWQKVDVGIAPLAVSATLGEGDQIWVAYATMFVEVVDNTVVYYPPGDKTPETGILVLDARTGKVAKHLSVPSQPWDMARWRGDVYINTNLGVYRLSDGKWIGPPRQVSYYLGFSLLATEDALYAGMWDGVWRWDGKTWAHVLPLQRKKVVDMTRGEGYLYAGARGDGVYQSKDGLKWSRIIKGDTPYLLLAGRYLYAGGQGVVVWDTETARPVVRYNLLVLSLTAADDGGVWAMTPKGTIVLER